VLESVSVWIGCRALVSRRLDSRSRHLKSVPRLYLDVVM
jgi:hypothetical protein